MGTLEISWLTPSKVWIEININGASKSNSSIASYGGLNRDSNGHLVVWLC